MGDQGYRFAVGDQTAKAAGKLGLYRDLRVLYLRRICARSDRFFILRKYPHNLLHLARRLFLVLLAPAPPVGLNLPRWPLTRMDLRVTWVGDLRVGIVFFGLPRSFGSFYFYGFLRLTGHPGGFTGTRVDHPGGRFTGRDSVFWTFQVIWEF